MKNNYLCIGLLLTICMSFLSVSDTDWPEYLGGLDRNHYSPLDQVNTSNVDQLTKAWEYHTGDDQGQMQVNPLIINGILYGVTSSMEIFALNAANGHELWRFRNSKDAKWYNTSRGLAYWENGEDKRIFIGVGNWLYAINAISGELVSSFGKEGKIDLRKGLGPNAAEKFVASTTPGTIFKNSIIMPLRLSEGSDAAPGYIQCFDVLTGDINWVFKTIPEPNEYGYDTWQPDNYKNEHVGGANNWAGMSVDVERGIVYVPTGSAAYDFYGADRTGNNLFANCLIALNASTGKRIWHYQFTHHDVWDRDLPAPPNLITITRKGKKIDAVAQITKQGYVFIFDRVTGEPIYKIKEQKVDTKGVEGEVFSPTQPIPTEIKPYARQTMKKSDISPYAPDKEELLATLSKIKTKPYSAPTTAGTLIFPGYDGGAEWGGAAYDPTSGIMYINSNEMPWILTLEKTSDYSDNANLSTGEISYMMHCSSCHQKDRKGLPKSGYPSLVNVKNRNHIQHILTNGKGMMPGFGFIKEPEKQALIAFLVGEEKKEVEASSGQKHTAQPSYKSTGYHKFLDANGNPAVKPPWGTLSALNVNTGKYLWQKPLGEIKELMDAGYPITGSENYGGAVVTAGGLLFIAATKDGKFRAFDKKSGGLLWETTLPAAAFATPSIYSVNGKQYIVIACGGNKLGTAKGDSYVAYAIQ